MLLGALRAIEQALPAQWQEGWVTHARSMPRRRFK
jgi:hypothetical protein